MYLPDFGATYKNYRRKNLINDVSAGVVVGIVALPLAISFGVASGVSPINGIYATIAASIIMALYGGIKVQISGPTGACILIVYAIITKYGINGLVLATLLAGIMLMLMGVLRMGRLVRLIPDPLIEGFTAGIAIDLFVSQIRDFTGIKIAKLPVEFLDKVTSYCTHVGTVGYLALGIGCLTVFINLVSPFILPKRIPGPVLAIVIPTLLVFYYHLPVDTIGTRFGTIAHVLPNMQLLQLKWSTVISLLRPAFGIAVLVSVMSLISGTVAESVTGFHLRSNKELVAQGMANILSAFVGGIPVTGSIARTMTNVENGGNTPIAGLVQSVVLVIILFFARDGISYIPVASVAGLLMVVAYNMSKWKRFLAIIYSRSGDTLLMLVTFFITLFLNFTAALEIGFLFATVQFMRKMSKLSDVREITANITTSSELLRGEKDETFDLSEGISVYEINGPLFFGAAYKFKETFHRHKIKPRVFIVRMRNVPVIDATGVTTILKVAQGLKKQNVSILISELNPEAASEQLYALFESRIGPNNIFPTFVSAIQEANFIVSTQKQYPQDPGNDPRMVRI